MMRRFHCLFVLSALVQVISSQGPPRLPPGFHFDKCAGPPPGIKNPHECCKLAPFFSEDDLAECGFKKPEEEDFKKGPDCTRQMCLFEKKGFLNDDKSVNYEAMHAYSGEWVQDNPEFESAAEIVKTICMGEHGPPGPPEICEPDRVMFCIGAVLFTNCPTWQDSEECTNLKTHMDECKAKRPPLPPH